MTYTGLAVVAVVAVALLDLLVLRTRLLTRRLFWVSYAIVVLFQLVTNGVLTGFRIVRYDGSAILGSSASICSIWLGRAFRPATIRWPSEIDKSRTRPRTSASIANPIAMWVSALVEATAISGPACR